MKKLINLLFFLAPLLLFAQINLVYNNNNELCWSYDMHPLQYVEDTLPDGTSTRVYNLSGQGRCRFPDSTVVVWDFPCSFAYPHGSDSSFFNMTRFVIEGHHPVVMKKVGIFELQHIDFNRLAPRDILPMEEPIEVHTLSSLNLNEWQMPQIQCSYKENKIYGNVKVVSSSDIADFKVRIVERDEFTSVKIVIQESTRCGEWKFVDSGYDFTVKFVEYGEDFTICYRNF